jgi:hypothetical protein
MNRVIRKELVRYDGYPRKKKRFKRLIWHKLRNMFKSKMHEEEVVIIPELDTMDEQDKF